ncbi:MAG: methyltransferase domain-containing protein [Dehalococcoidia bacterium]|nr:methyltransferase domain-containing protein [Dehalococcoidia bacterium]
MTSWFDESPETYDRARPTYPDSLWDELFARLPEAPSLLEIGPGPGKATVALLGRGATVAACEPGPNLAAYLRDTFPTFSLAVLKATFESANLPSGAFDGIVAATSFHWVDSSIRLAKSHTILKAGGLLAVIDTIQVADRIDRGYFAASQPIYDRYFPGDAPPRPLPTRDVVPPALTELLESALFASPSLHRYDWDQRYTTAEYLDLVRSYSNTAQLEPDTRHAFLADLAAFIDAGFEGHVVRPLVITLCCAKRAP